MDSGEFKDKRVGKLYVIFIGWGIFLIKIDWGNFTVIIKIVSQGFLYNLPHPGSTLGGQPMKHKLTNHY